MRRFSAMIALAGVLAAAPAAAQEDRASLLTAAGLPAPVAEKIGAAMANVTSYRVRVTLTGSSGMDNTLTVRPAQKRSKVVESSWGIVTEMIFADGRGYRRVNDGDWHVLDLPPRAPGAPSPAKAFLDMTKITPLPDRVENGVTVGAYQMEMRFPAITPTESVAFTCTYDKTTYLPRACANNTSTQTFEGWNDPANIIDIPVVAAAPISH